MPSDTLKRDGSWRVELTSTLAGSVDFIEIAPPLFSHVIRWNQGAIPSTLALLSELCGQPEAILRQLKYPDVDRVMLAFANVIPPILRKDFESGVRPLSTPVEELKERPPDSTDPRFPAFEGPLKRFTEPPKVELPREEEGGLSDTQPPAFKTVI